MTFEIDYARYLAAKTAVDDRALNALVLEELHSWLDSLSRQQKSLKIVEVGGGIGAMAVRLQRKGFFNSFHDVTYDIVETKKSNLSHAKQYIKSSLPNMQLELAKDRDEQEISSLAVATIQGHHVSSADNSVQSMSSTNAGSVPKLTIKLICADAFEYATTVKEPYDLLICAAFMDLIDIFEDTNRLLQALRSEGGIYLPINFDGTTYFEPRYSEGRNAVDELIESRFHELMGPESCTDEKYYPRSCTGRRLLGIFTENSSLSLQSFGSSAW
eukprot:CAMPEP_0198730022 /NCGR_PEP_ID=MMETSP1475-20131203/22432_1 /TAXON_ID= ORGANISM="Unidentified sp., Strain CCMP1999" /NCGR_SAMPLE_ID=MMETSP1475 /ASSEMBLY_ACC=CAM_ASM_001111 /LENGTH=271 /DNA_ID=CAMNT_0044492765 /DNA_START=68 /DNA_END=880 /DNA_ORIENTATION=+